MSEGKKASEAGGWGRREVVEGGGVDEEEVDEAEERERERRRPGPASCGRGVEMDSASEGSSSLSEFMGEVWREEYAEPPFRQPRG